PTKFSREEEKKTKTMSSEAEKSNNSAPATPPPYFWGDMPEEEYYTSQGVRNTKSYFETPNGKLFTQSFLPLDGEIKGTVYMSHGYGSDTSWMFQKICMSFCNWGYAVFAADLLGHGRSDGIRCYLGDMEKVAATSLCFFKHVRDSEPYKHLPAFLFGESMGGLATLLMYFQSEPDTWTGLIFSAPLFVIPEDMKPSKTHLFAYGLLFGLADTWAAMPDNKMVGKAIHDPEKLKIIAANPQRKQFQSLFFICLGVVLSLLNERKKKDLSHLFQTPLQNSQKKDKNKEPWNCCEINGAAVVRLPSNHRISQELDMKPSKTHLFAYGLLFGLADKWAAMPDNKMVGKAIHDLEKLKIIAANPEANIYIA
ncbi:unnamed protein product, partial [Brassica napus]